MQTSQTAGIKIHVNDKIKSFDETLKSSGICILILDDSQEMGTGRP